jgi:preprotein translocase subunit SecA
VPQEGIVETSIDRRDPVQNAIGWRQRLARVQGVPVQYDLERYHGTLADIARHRTAARQRPDAALAERTRQLRASLADDAGSSQVRTEMFALAAEAARRAVGLQPFDEQVLAGLALADGHIVEMQTGEGKTLAAVMPASWRAIQGRGIHVLTFNDYLARRDAEWMGPIYEMLGLSVAFIEQRSAADQRRLAYRADVTYVTAKDAGFDLLRDFLVTDPADLVHRPFHAAIVDEADSLLIDEARVPLVIAGSVGRAAAAAPRLAALVATLTPGVDFDLDEYARDVELTEAGIEHVERRLGIGRLHAADNVHWLTEVNCALHAHVLLRREVDYIVRDGRIGVVDELTGRIVADRHWPDGLQAALEAKEGLSRQPDGRTLGTITLQHVLGSYPHFSGMTGTARAAADELHDMYGLQVVVVPTHRPMIRVDHPDVVFTHREAKERALVAEIQRVHASQQPVLVGTLSIEESERLAGQIRHAGIACRVLNAKNDAAEASIISAAGTAGAVTISTNMAGRGTDIRLGDGVAERGGLYVIGTNRHESLRVDLQLRGRAGRQGDPGESRFFVSLDDDLMVRFGLRSLLGSQLPGRQERSLDSPVVPREIDRAQRIIEGQNREIRSTLWRYASVVERQRAEVMTMRQALLTGEVLPSVWQREPERRRALVTRVGEENARRAEQLITLRAIDDAWRDQLALAADLREGIHLVALGGQDPLTRFTADLAAAFQQLGETVENAVAGSLDRLQIRDGQVELETLGLRGPSSTWTYLVNDDPFRNQIMKKLTGPGQASLAIYAAAMLGPLLLLWGIVDRFFRRRPPRRPA